MDRRKAGRPKQLKLVTIDKAIELVKNFYLKKGVGEDEIAKFIPARQTIYNKIYEDVLHNHGNKRKGALLDENEVLDKLCS